jgi:hypothetical protein
VTNYLIWGGYYDYTQNVMVYEPLGTVGAGANSFEAVGVVDGNGNNLYEEYDVAAVYPDGSLSQGASWFSYHGSPAPGVLNAYVDATGTNIILVWTPAEGSVSGYVIQKSEDYGQSGTFGPLGQVIASTNLFEDTNGVAVGSGGIPSIMYEVQATYPGGGLSSAVTALVTTNPPAPSNVTAAVDATGTNVLLTWAPAVGNVTNYIVMVGVFNSGNGTYTYSQIGVVNGSTTSFRYVGGIAGVGSYKNIYEVEAVYPGDNVSAFDSSALANPPQGPIYNLHGFPDICNGY